MSSLDQLTTEAPNPRTADLDALPTIEALRRLNDEDQTVATAVRAALPSVAEAVEVAVERWQRGGRIVLYGAGTSGRLAALDAAELGPTFSVPTERYSARLAGGPAALSRAVEGAEDDAVNGASAAADVDGSDVAFGIAASGRTPWVIGALQEARRRGAATIGLACVASPELAPFCDVCIVVETGPEAIAGSTRLKAGTAQKLVLNAFSSTLMIRLGKVYGNLMIDVQVTNRKLFARATRLVQSVAGVDAAVAAAALEAADREVKTAAVMLRRGLSAADARARLASAGGRLRDALDER